MWQAFIKLRDIGRSIAALPKQLELTQQKLDRLNASAMQLPLAQESSSAVAIYKVVTDSADCNFYHAEELPDGSLTNAQWDLRQHVDEYLGRVDYRGKTVIEVGPASGYLTFYMESKGAQVICIEPPMNSFWDFVPRAESDLTTIRSGFRDHIQRIRNSFWYFHGVKQSAARFFEVNPYSLPEDFPTVDIGLFGSVLLHSSCPLRLLQSVAGHVTKTMIIAEQYFDDLAGPVSRLVPSPSNTTVDTWWQFSPQFFEAFLAVIGFSHTRVIRHRQRAVVSNDWIEMFTVVADR
ncbi:MAG TPA: hypothetical protein VFZ14_07475 [Burkholderiales bacterium]|nr:hypothetical protein [Burkholderiales bacterium]